ncbi:hypothetical protein [Nonomuraea gerenzanensis]|uniref:Uncharacterized protein n=1 Tax=Nonomuraea gerenzanensis TaxID=93944 RepID=A0A1M4BL68_9ACTN|nr:hypothetical protein [Nonomuraea gerenzanensis]UBU19225.1 hypothetical protein LCN96_56385 [Nonomuraea gerenzanensis]SAP16253.1 hypothetical protein BN4615_P11059 [Nonomuraea gerenzanensis]
MFTNFKIDQAATFRGVAFLSSSPKTAFGSTQQETTKDGTPKWTVEVIGSTVDQFGKPANEVVKIGIASHTDPGKGLTMYTPIELSQFEIGVMEKTRKNPTTGEEKIIGVQVWFRAEAVRPIAAAPPKAA